VMNGVPEDYGFKGLQPGITFARIDYQAYGGAIGDLLGECIAKNLGGKAEVLMLAATEGTAGKKDQEDAMIAALAKAAPGAKIVATEISKDRNEAQTKVGQMLQAHPNAAAVMGSNDEGSLGSLGAFKAAGKKLACDVAGGGNDEVLADVKSGELYGVAALQFGDDLAQTLQELTAMLKDPKAVGHQLSVPLKAIKTP
jgi:ribose transport system substrate-binding protein